jgi:hypothetical protein
MDQGVIAYCVLIDRLCGVPPTQPGIGTALGFLKFGTKARPMRNLGRYLADITIGFGQRQPGVKGGCFPRQPQPKEFRQQKQRKSIRGIPRVPYENPHLESRLNF